jgi:hypothetical protein
LRVLVSTFKQGDMERVTQAMRTLPYDQLVLVVDQHESDTEELTSLGKLEETSGHAMVIERVDRTDFLSMVEDLCGIILRHGKDRQTGMRRDLVLNISGGSKLLADAALLAAFRLGIAAYHCDADTTRLPVIYGATAKDRFTAMQARFIESVGDGCSLDDLVFRTQARGRQPVERILRELKKHGLVDAQVKGGKVIVSLTDTGAEVASALRLTAPPRTI